MPRLCLSAGRWKRRHAQSSKIKLINGDQIEYFCGGDSLIIMVIRKVTRFITAIRSARAKQDKFSTDHFISFVFSHLIKVMHEYPGAGHGHPRRSRPGRKLLIGARLVFLVIQYQIAIFWNCEGAVE